MGAVHMVRKKHSDPSQLGSFKKTNSFSSPVASSSERASDPGTPRSGNVPTRRSTTTTGLFALKSIQLARMSEEFILELKNEIDILKSLDHPNIVKPTEVFHRKRQINVVMELCAGGDLYTRDPYTETQAASITGQVLSAISYMHSRNITHRDLKFENIMFENTSPDAAIKVIDFGLSKKYCPDSPHLIEGVGTIYTMAPQVLRGFYTSQADLWSMGVIAFMLLCGEQPFTGRKRRHVIDKIMRCQYGFGAQRWKTLSKESKDFVEHLIEMNPKTRWNADQALTSPWMTKVYTADERAADPAVLAGAATSLKKFGEHGHLAKMALMVIAHQSTTEEVLELRKVFDQ